MPNIKLLVHTTATNVIIYRNIVYRCHVQNLVAAEAKRVLAFSLELHKLLLPKRRPLHQHVHHTALVVLIVCARYPEWYALNSNVRKHQLIARMSKFKK